MGFFRDFSRCMDLQHKRYLMEDEMRRKGEKMCLVPKSPRLRTDYLATDTIYIDLLSPYVIYIFRRYVRYVERPTADMSRRVRKENTSYVDLHICLTSAFPISESTDEGILNLIKQWVLDDTYEFANCTEFEVKSVEYSVRGMESHLSFLKKNRFKFHTKKRIAALKAVLKQEVVISKQQPKYPD